jgi:hypothetical protein
MFLILMNSRKVVTKPAPEGFNPGAKAGVQKNYNYFKILDSGFPAGLPGNDVTRVSMTSCGLINLDP